jgi:hypothetical protein
MRFIVVGSLAAGLRDAPCSAGCVEPTSYPANQRGGAGAEIRHLTS